MQAFAPSDLEHRLLELAVVPARQRPGSEVDVQRVSAGSHRSHSAARPANIHCTAAGWQGRGSHSSMKD